MNREIKFRVWDKAKQNWFDIPNALCFVLNKNSTELVFITDRGPYKIPDTNQPDGGMNRFVIQQYTGLKDKNDIDVYEGDIVKINRCYTRPYINEKNQIGYKLIDDGEIEVGEIIWGFQKYLVSYEHHRYDDIEDFDKVSHRVEVIGNIFENPELLK